MRSRRALGLMLAAVLAAVMAVSTSCADSSGGNSSGGNSSDGGSSGGDVSGARPIKVVTSFYPLAFVVGRIGGDRVDATNMTPPGVEPHDLEIASDQVDRIEDADLVVVLGGGFQPGIEAIAGKRDRGVLDVFADVKTIRDEDAKENADPHVWLDPTLMSAIAAATRDALAEVDPEGAAKYSARAERLDAELRALDVRYRVALTGCRRSLIVTSHDSFGRLANRYGLRHEGIAGLSPESEPDPARIAELADLVERTGIDTVFTEELIPTDLAETLAREAGVQVEVLSPLEGLQPEDVDAGADYFSVMADNLVKLRTALGCPA